MDRQSSGKLPIGAIVENSKPAPIPTLKTHAGEQDINRPSRMAAGRKWIIQSDLILIHR